MRNGNAETGDIFKISHQKPTTGMSKDDQKINIQNSPLNQKQNQNLHELYVTGEKNDITITVSSSTSMIMKLHHICWPLDPTSVLDIWSVYF